MSTPKKVTGLGGIFFKCDNPATIREWYAKHLGFNVNDYGTTFETSTTENTYAVWSPFPKTTTYFGTGNKEFMINLRVENLEWLLGELKKDGIEPLEDMQVHDYGKFAHIVDPEGNKVELWEPENKVYGEMVADNITG